MSRVRVSDTVRVRVIEQDAANFMCPAREFADLRFLASMARFSINALGTHPL